MGAEPAQLVIVDRREIRVEAISPSAPLPGLLRAAADAITRAEEEGFTFTSMQYDRGGHFFEILMGRQVALTPAAIAENHA